MKYSAPLVLTLSFGLTGCGFLFGEEGYFRDRGDDYLKAESMSPMQVPDNADPNVFGQLFVVPDINKADYEYPSEFTAPRPEALSANVYSESVKIQRLGEDSWIFVNASPSEIWPRVRNFLNSNNLQVARTDAPRGVIETAWLNFKDDPDSRDKYRLRIEQGIQPDSAEIHVTHLSMPREAELPSQVEWPAQSSSAERESWMINELAASLAAEIGSASASLLAQTIGGDEKISIVARDREPVLRMELSSVRAWASLNYALEQEGLQTIDEDSVRQMYYVHYQDPEQSEGFFSGWFSRDEANVYTIDQLLANMEVADSAENRALFPEEAFSRSGERLQNVPGYLFIMREYDNGIDVHVRDATGQTLEPRTARELLNIARRNLI